MHIKKVSILLWSAVSTKLLATFAAVYGWFITPISWDLALLIWSYALIAFLITDFLKIHIYKLLDHTEVIFHK